nr:hypothetical protein [Pandoravirus massiliensis]
MQEPVAASTATRRPLTVRKPKATVGWEERESVPEAAPATQNAAAPAVADAPFASKGRQARHGQGKAGPSAAERSVDLRAAYRARMAAMRTSRVGGARRQARNEPEVTEQPEAPQPAAPAGPVAPPALGLSRSQRKRLARSAKSAAVVDAALSRAGVSDPVSRAALANAISEGVGDGTDDAIIERVTRALTK